MKRGILKRVICVAAAVSMLAAEGSIVSAAEMPLSGPLNQAVDLAQLDTDGDGLVYGVVDIPEDNGIMPLALPNGEVLDDGVRLRSAPSSTASVLGLMYRGEGVCVSVAHSTGSWLYLQRVKTGTWGYAASYLISW